MNKLAEPMKETPLNPKSIKPSLGWDSPEGKKRLAALKEGMEEGRQRQVKEAVEAKAKGLPPPIYGY